MIIFKVVTPAEWQSWQAQGVFDGAPIDKADGFVHFSAADQVEETVAKHFAGKGDLVLVAVDADSLGEGLAWEPSRGGALFPRHYGTVPLAGVRWHRDLPARADGSHGFPQGWAEDPTGGKAP